MGAGLRGLEARAGEKILPKWRLLLRWARGMTFRPGPGILWRQTPDGVLVRAVPGRGWPHPFRCRLGERTVTVSPGTLDGGPVWIGESQLDGTRWNGDPGERPALDLGSPPEEGAWSWVLLRRDPNPGVPGGIITTGPLAPDAQPLCLVLWEGGVPVAVRQIVRHHLASAKGPAEEGVEVRRVFFWAV